MPYPHMVIHTCVYYYKMVAYADRPSYMQKNFNTTIWVQKVTYLLYLLHHNLIANHLY